MVTEMLAFMQEVDFSVPAAFSAYIPPASEVAKKARSFRYRPVPYVQHLCFLLRCVGT